MGKKNLDMVCNLPALTVDKHTKVGTFRSNLLSAKVCFAQINHFQLLEIELNYDGLLNLSV